MYIEKINLNQPNKKEEELSLSNSNFLLNNYLFTASLTAAEIP